jgi:iron complex outermembrane receptor protein
MSVKRILWLWMSVLLPGGALAQTMPDTLVSKKLPEVQIIGYQAKYTLGTRQLTLDSTYLRVAQSDNLADILQARTPIYIKNYGHGMLSTVSFRGTSASQTAVLWHGFNLNLPTLGQTDFSLIQVAGINSVQIQHGSGGANFGSGAVGGTVLLSSSARLPLGLQFQVRQEAGSFGYYSGQAGGQFGSRTLSVDASIYHKQAQNNFKFKNTTQFGAPYQRQENAALHQQGFTTNVQWRPNARHTFALRNWFTDNDNQAQPNMVAANTHARMANRNWRLMSEWNHTTSLGNLAVRVAYFNDYMRYRDDNTNAETQVNTYQAQAEHGFILGNKINIDLGGETQYFTAVADGYGKPVNETRASAFLLFRYDPRPFLHLNLNFRQALVSGFNPPLAPTAGFMLDIITTAHHKLGWKGNLARGYRVPTLNDRYWPTGNTDLKPENSYSYETGLVHEYTHAKLSLETELTAYWMRVNNWIQWVPTAGTGVWSPQNLKRVHTGGLEYSAKLKYTLRDVKLTGGLHYSYTSSQQAQAYGTTSEPIGKQLIYVPYHTASTFTDILYKTGRRYTTAENERSLPDYGLLTIYGGKTFTVGKTGFQVTGRVHNLTNQVYQNLEYYAMPGRHYTLGLRFSLQ